MDAELITKGSPTRLLRNTILSACGGIGRHISLRGWRPLQGVRVRVPPGTREHTVRFVFIFGLQVAQWQSKINSKTQVRFLAKQAELLNNLMGIQCFLALFPIRYVRL